MKRPFRVLYLFHQSLAAPISRLHGLAQVVALSERRPFAVISFEPRIQPTMAWASAYEQTRSWLLENGVPHRGIPAVGTRWIEIPMGAVAAAASVVFGGTRIIHARSYIPGLMALLVAAVLPAKFLFDMRGLFVDEYLLEGAFRHGTPRLSFARWLERRLVWSADEIIVVSEKFRDHLLARDDLSGNLDPGRITVIPNRVDLERYDRARGRREHVRAGRGWDGSLVFVYVGSAARWHRLDSTVRMMARILESTENARFVASIYPDPEPLRRLAAQAGVPADRMELTTSGVDEIPELLTAADLGLMLIDGDVSKQVCAPVKFSEYMAAGLPVIAGGGIGDTRDWIQDEDLGVLVDIDDPAAAAEAVLGSLSEGGLASADARRRCLDFARSTLDMRETLEQYEAVYRELESR